MLRSSDARFRMIGLLPLVFFIAQTIHYWRFGGMGNLAWMCNVGNLLLAIGSVSESPGVDPRGSNLDNSRTSSLVLVCLVEWFDCMVVDSNTYSSSR